MNPTGCPVHSALQGWWGLTSPRQRLSGDQWQLRKSSPPQSILHRCTREKEAERSLTWQMSPERRNLVPGETINSSLQWLSEGLRASGGPAGEKCGGNLPLVFRVSGGSGFQKWSAYCLRIEKEKKNTRRVPHTPQVRQPITSTRMREWIPAATARSR